MIMITIWIAIKIFLEIIFYLIIFDIILSWLTLLWFKFRPDFLSQIIDPIYSTINKYIPTTFWMFRFDALIAILIIYFLQGFLLLLIPELWQELLRISNS